MKSTEQILTLTKEDETMNKKLSFIVVSAILIFGCGRNVDVTSNSGNSDETSAESLHGLNETLYDAWQKEVNAVSLFKSGDISEDRLRNELEKIAIYLAQRANLVKDALPTRVRDREGEAPLSQLHIADSLPHEFQARGGRTLQVNFALAKRSPEITSSSRLRVAVDPDDFPIRDSGTFIAYSVDSEGNVVSEDINVEAYNSAQPFPLLLVNTSPTSTVAVSLKKV